MFLPTEEAASDDKKGKLYKPKSRFETAAAPKSSFLPLETPPQFLTLDKRHVCIIAINIYFTVARLSKVLAGPFNGLLQKVQLCCLSSFQTLKKTNEKEKKKSNLELFKEELKQ